MALKYEEMHIPLVVNTPAGQCRTTLVSHNIIIEIEGLEFHPSRIILKSSNIDLILGMDWLKAHTASMVVPLRPFTSYILLVR